ncbi:hypothetical protein [Chitinophaga sp. HK235]|uniref:hypothetical protein n=1 Tax=Chitinophaga sp. HK235 TaxID=2952571 RepID=UPI001BA44FDA|nr:hypothetical protein [Chitinophaga sp. HK235]
MMRIIIGCILSLCFILLKGYAHTHGASRDYSFKQNFGKSVQKEFEGMQGHKDHLSKVPSSGKRKISDRIKETEIEEESESGFKKLLETGTCHISSFYALEPGCIFPSQNTTHPPFFALFSYAATDKVIVNRVIRI